MSKAASTRYTILQKAFELIYKKGYQATSIDDILATTKVTKGAFYYHFKSKDEMGLAMIEEVMYPGMHQIMIKPLHGAKDGISEILLMLKVLLYEVPFLEVKYGCPAVNLIEEMAPLKPEFQTALNKLVQEWKKAIGHALKTALTPPDFDYDLTAQFIINGYTGARNLGKLQGYQSYTLFLRGLEDYLKPLK